MGGERGQSALTRRTERENTRSDRGLSPACTIKRHAQSLKRQHHARAVGIMAVTSAGAFWTKVGMHMSGHAMRLPFLTSVQGVPKSPRIAAIPSARSPISRRLYFFQRCPWSMCQGRKTSASPPLSFQRPFPALTCTQHAGSLRHLPKPTARVLLQKATEVWTRTAAQDSNGAGNKKKNSRLAPPLEPKNPKDNREFENFVFDFGSRWLD